MRFVSWNVNSLRSRWRRLFDWLDAHEPDVVALQETKCSDAMFAERFADDLRDRGYAAAHHGVNHWNGVAILSQVGLDDVRRGFTGANRVPFDEPRLIRATCGGVEMWSVYAPNGRALDDPHYLYKLVWFERLRAELSTALANPSTGHGLMMLGDFNVAHTDLDVYDPKRWRNKKHASPPERAAIDHLLDIGVSDITRGQHPEGGLYTWWNYRPGQFEANRGLRIDLALADPHVAGRVDRVWIDTDERADDRPDEKPSDHAPLVIDLHP